MAAASNALERGRSAIDWYLAWASRRGEGPTDVEVQAVLGSAAEPSILRALIHKRTDLSECRLVTEPVEEVPGRVVADAVGADGTRMRAVAVVRDDGNIHVMVVKALPDGSTLREAATSDGPRLGDLCRSVPIVTGPIRTTIDYGEDYLRATDVADTRIVLVVEREGRIVGMHGCVIHDGVFGEDHHKLAYLRHTRIDPTLQRAGTFSALNGGLFERGFAAGANPYSLVAVGNSNMLAKLPEFRHWPWHHDRFHIDTRAVASSSPLAVIDPADASSLINILNDGASITPPTTTESLLRRFRNAHVYGPDRLLGNAHAVMGVSRAPIRVTVEDPEGAEQRSEVVACDFGATDADAFVAVLQGWCHRLAADGVDDLAVDASTGSPVHSVLAALARSVTTFALQLSVPPPPRATGFRVDPSYI